MQTVLGTRYIDEPIRLDVDTNGDGDCLDSGGSTFYYYHQDANYNVIALTDSSGDVVHRYLYDAYGTPHTYTVNSDGVSMAEVLLPGLDADGDGDVDVYNPFLFNGQPYDTETGFYYYRTRYLDPRTGRFTTRDSIGIWGDPGNAGNGYAYVGGNPLRRVDPYGLGVWDWVEGGYGWVGGALEEFGQSVDDFAAMIYTVATDPASVPRGLDEAHEALLNAYAQNYVNLYTTGGDTADTTNAIFATIGESTFVGDFLDAYEALQAGDYRGSGQAGFRFFSGAGGLAAVMLGACPRRGPKVPDTPTNTITQSVGDLRAAGKKDAHHVIQDAAVRDLPEYSSSAAPGVQLPGPSTLKGSPHYNATRVQALRGGGTYGAERRIGYKALRRAGYLEAEARQILQEVDDWFRRIGVDPRTPTRIPGNRSGG